MMMGAPALRAFRNDLAANPHVPGGGIDPRDTTWLAIARTLQAMRQLTPRERARVLPSVERLLALESPSSGDRLPPLDPRLAVGRLPRLLQGVRAAAERMEDAGALQLADSALASLEELALGQTTALRLERGRIVAQRARIAWKTGKLELAKTRYAAVERLGRAAALPELRVRALIGFTAIAQLRGNYPALRRCATRAARLAESGRLAALAALAHHFLLVGAAVARDWSGAVVHGWHAYRNAVGDAAREAEGLINLAQILSDAGHPESAIHGFEAALARCPIARLALAGAGGLAVASAATGDRARVEAAARLVRALAKREALPYQSAAAQLEIALAYRALGDETRALRAGQRVRRVANRYGYHELLHRVDALLTAAEPTRRRTPPVLTPEARRIATSVAALGPARGDATLLAILPSTRRALSRRTHYQPYIR